MDVTVLPFIKKIVRVKKETGLLFVLLSLMKNYDTVSEALTDLQRRGFTYNFNLKREYIECKGYDIQILPEEFEITEAYRFEGETDPADESVVYAIESKKHQVRGVLVNAYGAYADGVSGALAAKFQLHRRS